MTALPLDDLSTSVPLSWLVAQRELGLQLKVRGATDPAIWIAHAIEVTEPEEWLRGGEFVLTTGIRLPRGSAAQETYVAGLAEHGAAALGFGVGMRFATIPEALVAACVAVGLPLVEVPLPTPFVAIARTVSDRLAELRTRRLQEVLDGQRSMTRSALRDGVPALARTLSRLIEAGVLVSEGQTTTLARHGAAPTLAQLQAETGGRPGALSAVAPGRSQEFIPFGPRTQHPMGWVGIQRERPFGSSERLLVQHAAALLALLLVEPDADRSEHAVLLRGLLDGFSAAEVLTGCGLPDRGLLRWVAHADEEWVRAWEGKQRPGLHARTQRVRATPGVAWMSLVSDEDLPRVCEAPPRRAGISAPVVAADLGAAWSQAAACFDEAAPTGWVLADDTAASQRAVDQLAGPWLAALTAYDAEQGSHLTETLAAWLSHHGNADRAAVELGCHRHTLRHRLKKVAEVSGADLEDARTRALLTLALVGMKPSEGGSALVRA